MTSAHGISPRQIAFYDPERKGMFIHADQLADSPFKIGDRFSLRRGKRELFAMTIIKDDQGEIFLIKKEYSLNVPVKLIYCLAAYLLNMFFTLNLKSRRPSRLSRLKL